MSLFFAPGHEIERDWLRVKVAMLHIASNGADMINKVNRMNWPFHLYQVYFSMHHFQSMHTLHINTNATGAPRYFALLPH